MTLHTVGPANAVEDERVIGAGYQDWLTRALWVVPIIVASFADTKWVVAVGFGAMLLMLHQVCGRLHDLCIRSRRTNIILGNQGPR
jgi:hypothetical protein